MARAELAVLLRRALPVAACLMVAGYFLAHAVGGSSGLMALGHIHAARDRLLAERARLEAERADLKARIGLLDPRGADPDYADELVRRHLGVIRPDELVVPLPPAGPEPDPGERRRQG
ncbi:MAG: septum formation initiator family protein [Sphingomonadaceae bacterium]|uniref:FtsB family cell division protein n=1 Tax=Thermaurantiacus sp. TaxID=2820283 RepID=UPI00298F2823|nr:septum formation initiator family protein [Thermaurantiacus sp.]MCS6986620.1 septum formation initiator family protein [Sphingomonadaceae bacterium]MDW8414119.1 septum formation initiator family protein [Thermaurantiacus sp.]